MLKKLFYRLFYKEKLKNQRNPFTDCILGELAPTPTPAPDTRDFWEESEKLYRRNRRQGVAGGTGVREVS